jgi:hypothetical protein
MSIVLDGTTGITSPSVTGTPVIGGLVSGTAVASTSGTSIDFTGIPSWVKRVTVMFSGVSTNGTSPPQIQLGDSGGVENSGYLGANVVLFNTATVTGVNISAGFLIGLSTAAWAASVLVYGHLVLTKLDGQLWTAVGSFGRSDAASLYHIAGSKTLSDTLTQVRITTVNGTDTFDAGSINIMYEG